MVGDIVSGRGYNLPHTIQGVVVGLTRGATTCNLHVATLYLARPVGDMGRPYPAIYEEHGVCAEFELVYRAPGVALKTDAELGVEAFEGYNASTDGRNHDGSPAPSLDTIRATRPHVLRAWEAGAKAVRRALGL